MADGLLGLKRQRFRDRRDAGRQLARELERYVGRPHLIVLALPRGGIPVGYEIARYLAAPFDAMLVRKLGVPGHEELAMGAIASGGTRILNEEVMRSIDIDEAQIAAVAAREEPELERRERLYRGGASPPDVRDRTVIVVDDGLATGSTMRAATAAIRARGPKAIVIATPVASPAACTELESDADEVVCALVPEPFLAVGAWYERFDPPSDEEIKELLGGGR